MCSILSHQGNHAGKDHTYLLLVGVKFGTAMMEIVWMYLGKVGINLHQYPEIPFLGIYPKDS